MNKRKDLKKKKNNVSFPLILMHLSCFFVFLVPFEIELLLVFGFVYCLHVFTLTAGFHRYFSHNSFKTSRPFQFILGFLGTMAAQKDPLWWASHHRLHHAHADTELDPHSARIKGFWWSHIGWVMKKNVCETRFDKINDFRKFPELIWLNKYAYLPPLLLALFLYLSGTLFNYFNPASDISGFFIFSLWLFSKYRCRISCYF